MSVIGTAGHVDHGKSTLVERLTGIDPDRFEEEKRRGLTIDLGFAWLTLPSGRDVGVIDVPGHERFIQNMLAGAGGISACLFVVAANEGWMPQSAEHLSAVHLLGITSGVVALTKSDLVDSADLEKVMAGVEERLSGTNLEGSEIIPCSAITGSGLDDLVDALERVLERAPVGDPGDRARMWVDRSFSIQGAGSVVTGTLGGGALKIGDKVSVVSDHDDRPARIRGLQTHKREVDEIGPGTRTAVNLAGLDRNDVQRGDALCAPGQWAVSDRLNAVVEVLDVSLSGHSYELEQKGSHLLYVGSAETSVRIKLFGTRSIEPGNRAAAQLSLERALPLRRGDRFVLRDAGRGITLGGGVVVDPFPEAARSDEVEVARFILRLAELDDAKVGQLLLQRAGEMTLAEVRHRVGSSLVPPGGTILADRIVSAERLEDLKSRLLEALHDHHAAHALEKGMPKTTLVETLDLSPAAWDALLSLTEGVLRDGPLVRLASHNVGLSPELADSRDRLLAQLEASGYAPPPTATLEISTALVRALEDSGEVVRIADFHLTSDQVRLMKEKVRALLKAQETATIAQLRDLLGTSRRYAVPLCEWLDQVGFTRRAGDQRVLGPKA